MPLPPPPGGTEHPLRPQFLTYCLVKAETDEGLTGYGEISDGWGCEYARAAGALVDEALSRFVLGQDPTQPATLVERMWSWVRRRQGTEWLMCQAISGVELALWDLAGKAAGRPVSSMLGALRSRIPIYASGNFLSQGSPEVHHNFFRPFLEKGVRAIKVRLGVTWEAELETLAGLRSLLGRDVAIFIDGNEAFSSKTALRIVRRMEGLGVGFFEEPVPRTDEPGIARLVAESGVPIAYGEHVFTAAGFERLLERRIADVWQPDATVCGGLREARRINELAAQHGTPISPHSATTLLGLAANLHASATAPSLSFMEFSGRMPQFDALFRGSESLTLSDGSLAVPEGPGLGIEPLPELEERFPYQAPPLLNASPALYQGSV